MHLTLITANLKYFYIFKYDLIWKQTNWPSIHYVVVVDNIAQCVQEKTFREQLLHNLRSETVHRSSIDEYNKVSHDIFRSVGDKSELVSTKPLQFILFWNQISDTVFVKQGIESKLTNRLCFIINIGLFALSFRSNTE